MALRWRFAFVAFSLPVSAEALDALPRAIVAGTEAGIVFMRPGPGLPVGPGWRFRVGYQFASGATPEAVWSGSSSGAVAGSTARQRSLLYGLRWTGALGRWRPWIAAHVGMARVRWPNSGPGPGALPATGTTTGAAFEAAGGAELELVGGLSLMTRAGYTRTTVKVPALQGFGQFFPASWTDLSGGVSFVF
jgi:hypothetical protein